MVTANDRISLALEALTKAATKGKTKKSVLDTINSLSSSLVPLLNSFAPSLQAFSKLASVLRHPFVPLYAAYPDQALNLAASVLKLIIDEHLSVLISSTNESDFSDAAKISKEGWEKAIYALLSGVLDFLEDEDTEQSKSLVANRFYKTICAFFFASNHSNPENIGPKAKSVAFSILSDTCVLHGENQTKLRDSRLLGPKRLGMTICLTKDYVPLENLLTLFAQLLPSATASDKRIAFIRATFVSTKLFPSGDNIVRLLKDVAAKDWDIAATKIVDELAAADKAFPQPFNMDELLVCGHVFPQPELSDRLYLDRDSFLANILQEDELYETLLIRYGTVKSIHVAENQCKNKTRITMDLTTPPLLADQPLHVAVEESHPDLKRLNVIVEIAQNDVARFMELSKLRGLGHAFRSSQGGLVHQGQRISVSATEANLDHEEIIRDEVEAHSKKVEKVEKFYAACGGSDDAPIEVGDIAKSSLLNKDIANLKNKKARESSAGPGLTDSAKVVEPSLPDSMKEVPHGKKVVEAEGDDYHFDKSQSIAATGKLERISKTTKKAMSKFRLTEQLPKSLHGIAEVNMSAGEPVQTSINEKDKKNLGNSKSSVTNKLPKEQDKNASVSARSKRVAATAASAKIAVSMHDSGSSEASETEDIFEPQHTQNEHETRKTSSVKKTGDAKKLGKVKSAALAENNIIPLATKHTNQSNVDDTKKPLLPLAKSKQLQKTEKTGVKYKQAELNNLKKRKRDEADTLASEETKAVSKRKKENIISDAQAKGLIPKKRADSSALFSRDTLTSRATPKYRHRAKKIVPSPISRDDKESETESDSDKFSDAKIKIDYNDIPGNVAASASRTSKDEIDPDLMSEKTVLKSGSSPESKMDKKGSSMMDLNSKNTKASGTKATLMKSKSTLPVKIDEDGLPVMESLLKIRENKADISRALELSSKELDYVAHIPNVTSNVKNIDVIDTEDPLEEVTLFDPFEQNDNAGGQKEDLGLLQFQTNENNISSDQSRWNIDEISPTKKAHGKGTLSSNSEPYSCNKSPPFSLDIDLEMAMNTPSRQKTEKHFRNTLPAATLSSEVEHSDSAMTQSTPTSKASQKHDVVFIDLTTKDEVTEIGEDNKIAIRHTPKTRTQNIVHSRSKYDGYSVSPVREPTTRLTPSRPTVTFNPIPQYKQPSFDISLERAQSEAAVKRTPTGRKDKSLFTRKIRTDPRQKVKTPTKHAEARVKEPRMDEIVNILNAITETIVQNISRKSEIVQKDIRITRDKLLRDVISDLSIMQQDSVQHFEKMLTLETEYARFNRKVSLAQEEIGNINQEICSFVEQTVKDHDRNMLSKKFPRSLLPPLPAIFKI